MLCGWRMNSLKMGMWVDGRREGGWAGREARCVVPRDEWTEVCMDTVPGT